jgi:hypothetical protein
VEAGLVYDDLVHDNSDGAWGGYILLAIVQDMQMKLSKSSMFVSLTVLMLSCLTYTVRSEWMNKDGVLR